MTHEELLAKIEDDSRLQRQINALHAVVKLHRPVKDNEGMEEEYPENDGIGCAGCGYDYNYMMWESRYPCETIRAIEKELA